MANIAASRRYNRYEPKKYKIDETTIICSGMEKENVTRKSTPLQPPPQHFYLRSQNHLYLLADGA